MNDTSSKKSPFWLLPNLLSLDAPLVALLWMWILTKSMQVIYIEDHSFWLLAAAVWCVYVLDRIIDVWKFKGSVNEMSSRHRFHWKYWKLLLPVVIGVIIYSGYVAFNVASVALLTAGVAGFGLVLVYLLVSQFDNGDVAYAKNFIAGMTFSFGVAAPVVVESIHLNNDIYDLWYHFSAESNANFLLALKHGVANFFKISGEAIGIVFTSSMQPFLFGLLCFLNITGIDLWEKSRKAKLDEEKEICGAILGTCLLILVAYAVYLAAYKFSEFERPFSYVVMVSTALLYLINKYRTVFYLDAQRALADLAMVLPIPLVLIFYDEADDLMLFSSWFL